MKTQESKIENDGCSAQSVLDSGRKRSAMLLSSSPHLVLSGEAGSPQPSAAQSGHRALPLQLRPVCFYLLLCTFCLPVWGQYTIDWSTIDGGGGTSTGGVYSVSGTIGQPDAGKMSGGGFTLEGGFWAIIAAVQTPGAPLLEIAFTTTNRVILSWPYPSTGFNLEHSADLHTPNWNAAGAIPEHVGDRWQVILTPAAGNHFYRLRQP